MNVASLKLCKELYELSGWYQTHYIWRLYDDDHLPEWVQTFTNIKPEDYTHTDHHYYPAYDLGYLLRKLSIGVSLYKGAKGYTFNVGNSIQHSVGVYEAIRSSDLRSGTPEDAAAKLAIELFKQGILTKEVQS